ncbi:hypothetical protein ACI3E1_00005, partial [Ligilactobacillus sp. LYQ139]|uniref:hypothetical protein n=1 Tax=Ligilactobacillus sp. LYQ139 TaxID=3378800 RepID=UPI0038537F1E
LKKNKKLKVCAHDVHSFCKNIRKHMIHQKTKSRKINVLRGFMITYDSLKRGVQNVQYIMAASF